MTTVGNIPSKAIDGGAEQRAQTTRTASVAIVIVNYRTAGLVIDCLHSLMDQVQAIDRARVVIVDNASNDGSADRIEAAITERGWERHIELVRSDANLGFSGGNNLGIRAIEAESYLLLNSDTIVRPGAIDELMQAMREHPHAGLVSPRLEWPDGRPQHSCFRDRRPRDEFFRAARTGVIERLFGFVPRTHDVSDEPMECEWTSFACVLIRREVIEQIGGLDEGYFLYSDDVDYCRNARQHGWNVLHWPSARVVHLRGGSGPVKQLSAQRKRRPRYWYASRAHYYRKFFGRFGLWRANLYWWCGRVISLIREIVLREQPSACKGEWRDIWTDALRSASRRQS